MISPDIESQITERGKWFSSDEKVKEKTRRLLIWMQRDTDFEELFGILERGYTWEIVEKQVAFNREKENK